MKVVIIGGTGLIGSKLGERSLVPCADARLGEIRFEEWLGKSAPQPVHA